MSIQGNINKAIALGAGLYTQTPAFKNKQISLSTNGNVENKNISTTPKQTLKTMTRLIDSMEKANNLVEEKISLKKIQKKKLKHKKEISKIRGTKTNVSSFT